MGRFLLNFSICMKIQLIEASNSHGKSRFGHVCSHLGGGGSLMWVGFNV